MKKINTILNGKKIYYCENFECEYVKICEERATEHHHLYSDSQYARRTYSDIIDEDFNIIYISNRCHHWKSIPTYSEKEFIDHAKAEGYRVKTPKSLQFKNYG